MTFRITGSGAGPEGNRPFLDVLDTETHETKRLWQSSPPYLEDLGSLLNDKHDQPIKYVLLLAPQLALRCLHASHVVLIVCIVGDMVGDFLY